MRKAYGKVCSGGIKNGTITEISSNPGLGHLGATPPHSACECYLESGKLFYSLSILFLSLLIPCLRGVYWTSLGGSNLAAQIQDLSAPARDMSPARHTVTGEGQHPARFNCERSEHDVQNKIPGDMTFMGNLAGVYPFGRILW